MTWTVYGVQESNPNTSKIRYASRLTFLRPNYAISGGHCRKVDERLIPPLIDRRAVCVNLSFQDGRRSAMRDCSEADSLIAQDNLLLPWMRLRGSCL